MVAGTPAYRPLLNLSVYTVCGALFGTIATMVVRVTDRLEVDHFFPNSYISHPACAMLAAVVEAIRYWFSLLDLLLPLCFVPRGFFLFLFLVSRLRWPLGVVTRKLVLLRWWSPR